MKTVIIYANDCLEELLVKSNIWYIRHYEEYFDHVYMIYLRGTAHAPVTQGNTTLVSLAKGRGKLEVLLAPYRLYRFAKKIRPTHYVTPDQIWSWWLSSLVQLLLRAKIYLLPQFMPEQIYSSSKDSVSIFFPIWFERILIWLSYFTANKVLTGHCFGNYTNWLSHYRAARGKIIIVDALAEALPPPAFLEKLEKLNGDGSAFRAAHTRDGLNLIYVGRLQRQKLVDGLIKMLPLIRELENNSLPIKLTLVGDGPDRDSLERLANELKVNDLVEFVGQVQNDDLPEHLLRSDVYVSPLTGMSLREAALCGLPIVAYDMDWLHGFLKHDQTALMIPPGNYDEMARQIVRLSNDYELQERLSRNIKELAWRIWSPQGLRESLHQAFDNN
jgi:glycosyltransferase involved in cell wall biosynthesis